MSRFFPNNGKNSHLIPKWESQKVSCGRKNRRVIPACVVKAIRNEFPEESGEYAGFKPAEIDLN